MRKTGEASLQTKDDADNDCDNDDDNDDNGKERDAYLLSSEPLICQFSFMARSLVKLLTHHVVSWFPILTSDPLQHSPSCQRKCPNFNHQNLPFS